MLKQKKVGSSLKFTCLRYECCTVKLTKQVLLLRAYSNERFSAAH